MGEGGKQVGRSTGGRGLWGEEDEKLGAFFRARWISSEPVASWSTLMRLPKALMLSKEQMRRRKMSLGSSVPAD